MKESGLFCISISKGVYKSALICQKNNLSLFIFFFLKLIFRKATFLEPVKLLFRKEYFPSMFWHLICAYFRLLWNIYMIVTFPTRYIIYYYFQFLILFYNPFVWIRLFLRIYRFIKHLYSVVNFQK